MKRSLEEPVKEEVAPPVVVEGKPRYACTQTLSGHKKAVTSVKISPDGKWLLSASADTTVRLWSTTSWKCMHVLSHTHGTYSHGTNDASFSADSKYVASASDDRTIILWEVASGKKIRTLRGHQNFVFCVAFSPAGNLLASGSFDESLRIWSVKDGKCLKILPAHSDPVSGVDFSCDGTLIVSGSYDGLCRIWDTATGQCLKTLIDDDNPPVSFVKFSPNSKFILASLLDSTLRLWKYDKGKCLRKYEGHRNSKFCCFADFVTTAPSHMIVSGSEDGKACLWDLQSKKLLQTLDGHTDVVLGVAAHPTRELIVTGGTDKDLKSIRVWEASAAGASPPAAQTGAASSSGSAPAAGSSSSAPA